MPSRRRLLATLAAAAGAGGLAGCAGRGGSGFSPGRESDTEWPLPGRGPRARNYAREAVAPRTPPGERWRASTPQSVGRPVVAADTAFVPAKDAVYALRLRDGEERWRGSIAPYGVAVADGVAYATGRGEGVVTAREVDSGEERWRVETPGDFATAPLPAPTGDAVIVGDTEGRVAALEPRTGETRWSFEAFTGVYSLAARDDRVYVGTTGGEAYELHVVEADDDADGDDDVRSVPLWRRKLPGTVRALSASRQSVFAATFGGGVFRLATGPAAGRTEWRAPDAPTVSGALVRAGGLVVAAGSDGVAALRAGDGDGRWRVPGDPTAAASPAVAAGDTLYAGIGGSIRAYALGGGIGVGPYRADAERWRRDVPARGIAVADGALVVVADDLDGDPGVVVLE
ncbi:PQQ-binding-like beta-propeller repeat protein [Halobaculum sp. CBA1158]|uniref:outer membrane protein assembly factor BamB family protein n=1 Tax=Halobaculum sp. CBA1158 TaxID=2904243 RepID=UPI001F289803|nr:PQQ-binding-like beta-propeller repeat protein [Halobaculum sp. CBA1158]UIP00860.1 PQQ-binding-like beta-propeller repeat protein [Halobaculum sp. CBA1158]